MGPGDCEAKVAMIGEMERLIDANERTKSITYAIETID
jgi:hypothetical protein